MALRRLGANNPSSSKRLWVLLSQTSISTASNPSNFQRNRDVAAATPQDSELRRRDLTRRARNPQTRATEMEAMEAHGPRMCHCRVRATITTSWTTNNPGRRFYGCAKFKDRAGNCGYFVWYDPPICNRAKQIIPHLLNRVSKYRAREKTYWACMLLSWLITFVMVMLYANYKPEHVKRRPMLSLP